MAEPTHRAPPELIRHASAALRLPAAPSRRCLGLIPLWRGAGGESHTLRPPLLPEDQHYFLDQRPTLLLCTFLCYF